MNGESLDPPTPRRSSASAANEPESARDAHVWNIDLSRIDLNLSALEAMLSADEIARAARFVVPGARLQFVVGRACLRTALAARVQHVEPRALRFAYGAYGKPALVGHDDIHFNVSHSAERVVIVVSRVGPIGVDVERQRNDIAYDSLAEEHFCAGELARFRTAAAQDRAPLFFDHWTRKEAVAKALGVGLTIPLDTICLEGIGDSPVRARVSDSDVCWFTYAIDVGEGYSGAIATDSQNSRVTMRDW